MDRNKIAQSVPRISFVEPLSKNAIMNKAKLVDHYDSVWRVS